MTGVVYVTYCLVTKKHYVGIHTRNQTNYLGSGRYLGNAVKKYGRSAFVRLDVDTFRSQEEGLEKEREWIRELDSKYPNGYNLNDGGEGGLNPCHETRVRMRLARLGMRFSDVHKAKLSLAKLGNRFGCGNRGKHCSEIARLRKRIAAIGNTNGCGNKGKARPPDVRVRISAGWARRRGQPTIRKGRNKNATTSVSHQSENCYDQ